MAKSELRVWAVKGAEQRLVELAEEAKAIFAAFPELRGRGDGVTGQGQPGRAASAATEREAKPTRKRRKRSAEARKRMSEAQKARWAARRQGQRTEPTASKSAGARKKR